MDGNLVRLGGAFGLLSVIALISGLLVGFASGVGSLDDANAFFEGGAGAFVFFNGVIPLFFVVFFAFFLGSLHGMLQQAGGALPTVALVGGVVYLVLAAAALAAEVLYPAAALRFGDLESGGSFVVVLITLSAWLYHGSSMGGGTLALAASLAALQTGVLPRWLAAVGLAVALASFLHVLIPFIGFLAGLAWTAAVSVVMLAGGARAGGVRASGAQRVR